MYKKSCPHVKILNAPHIPYPGLWSSAQVQRFPVFIAFMDVFAKKTK